MLEWAVVGGGIGGVSTAALLSRSSTNGILLEKLPYLGGCSGTYTTGKGRFNVGATTLVGLESGQPLCQFMQKIGLTPQVQPIDPGMVVRIHDKTIRRWKDFERFLEELERVFPHNGNRAFWEKILDLHTRFWSESSFYYSKENFWQQLLSAYSLKNQIRNFHVHLFDRADIVIEHLLPDIDPDYRLFLNEQIRIVAQAQSHEVNFLVAALALGYTFMQNYTVRGGMGELFDQIQSKISEIHFSEEVLQIKPHRDFVEVYTDKSHYEARKVYLNSTLFDSTTLFESDSRIRENLRRESEQFASTGAFTLYLQIRSDRCYEHHYQILLPEGLPEILSHSFFVTFSEPGDNEIAPEGFLSMTVSTHTPVDMWMYLSKEAYVRRKRIVSEAIKERLFAYFPELQGTITYEKAGTPRTFRRYINRASVGGIPLKREYFRMNYPAPDTVSKCIWRVGDTVFPGQGWPGVVMGAMNAVRISGNSS